jgi:hypothetical protein
MKILPTGTPIYRGGACKTHMAFFAVDPRVARMYGSLCSYKTIRPTKLFVITHNSLQKVFKFLSKNTRLLLSFVFGTGIKRTNQEITLKRLTGNSPLVKSFIKKGERLSVTELDSIAMAAFSKEYLNKYGFDGVYMPRKKSKFHKGVFHTELYISKPGILKRVSSKRGIKPESYTRQSYSIKSIPNLFLEYTKNTKSLLKPHPSQFVMFLGGGMAVKLYLEARGIKAGAPTNDFDFKFALPRVLRSKKQVERYSEIMKQIMFRHVSGFIRFLKRRGINASMEFKEIEGVPLDRPGGGDSALRKKVYKVYNYTIVMPSGKRHELIDTSLVVVPKITRRHISLKWSRKFGLPIQTLTYLWKDTLYVLAGSFVIDTIKLRNPINGAKKEKGIKNAIRAGHLSYLVPRRYNLKNLVSLSRQLVTNVIIRNKKLGEIHSKKIIRRLHHLDRSRAQR